MPGVNPHEFQNLQQRLADLRIDVVDHAAGKKGDQRFFLLPGDELGMPLPKGLGRELRQGAIRRDEGGGEAQPQTALLGDLFEQQ